MVTAVVTAATAASVVIYDEDVLCAVAVALDVDDADIELDVDTAVPFHPAQIEPLRQPAAKLVHGLSGTTEPLETRKKGCAVARKHREQ